MIAVASVSFIFGVKLGQELSYERHGITSKERKQVQLKSWLEEDLEGGEEELEPVDRDSFGKKYEKKLKEKLEKMAEKTVVSPPKGKQKVAFGKKSAPQSPGKDKEGKDKEESLLSLSQALGESVQYKGKWTIQLGSYQDGEDAEVFSNGFKARGYRPIINRVNLGERGVWYRVGLGVFSSVLEAKEYIAQEESLFQGQDFTIVQLQ